MSFDHIIGNYKAKQTLTKIIESNTIMHSYMFIGPSGIGKALFAKEFAKMILCSSIANTEKPCNYCKSCLELENSNNPDLIEIEPENGTIKIEQIRKMTEKVLEKPIISNKKVYIIKDADTMTKEASNCLLKTLEEPPNYITIILTGSNESSFINTIKSRCMKIVFNKIQDDILKEYLEKQYKISLEENLIKACEGSIKKALRVIEKKEQYEETLKIFSNIEVYNLLDAIKKLNFMYENKEDIYEILDYINIILSNSLMQKPQYIQYIEKVEQTKRSLKSNSNYDMSIDSMIYKIWEE